MKLHAWVMREIEIDEGQTERLVNYLCGCVENSNIDDIKQNFTKGIECGDYDAGYISYSDLSQDLKEQLNGELRKYWEANECKVEDIGLEVIE